VEFVFWDICVFALPIFYSLCDGIPSATETANA
jgi:hypothetical protein